MERSFMTLESIVNDGYSIGLDTSVFMHNAVDAFMSGLEKELSRSGRFAWIPAEVHEELKRHTAGATPEKAEKAKRGLEWVQRLYDGQLLMICAPDPDGRKFADSTFLSRLIKKRIDQKIMLFTQDANLARDLLSLNDQKSVNGKPVRVMRLKADGSIGRFQLLYQTGEAASMTLKRGLKPTAIPADAPMNDDMILLDDGDSVSGLSGARYTLGRELTGGSEASIYEIEGKPELLAKVFPMATVRKFNKCKLLLDNRAGLPKGAIAPLDLIFDEEGRFAGYIMERVNGVTFGSLLAAPLRQQYAPEWDRRHFARLAHAFAKLAEELLLNANIVLGDISGGNVMVRYGANGKLDCESVALIDLDSAQFGSDQTDLLPAEGRTPDYAAPEELREGFSADKPRRISALYYSVALMTLTMLMDIHPFRVCVSEGEDEGQPSLGSPIADAIAAERFPFGGKDTRRAALPPDQIEKVWSNMSSTCKSFYVDVLQKDRPMNRPDDRPNLTRIRSLLECQLKWLMDPKTLEVAPEAYSLNPTELKPYFVTCAKPDCPRNGAPFKWTGRARTDGRYYCPECLARERQARQASFTMGWCPKCKTSFKVYGRQSTCPVCKQAQAARTPSQSTPNPAPRPVERPAEPISRPSVKPAAAAVAPAPRPAVMPRPVERPAEPISRPSVKPAAAAVAPATRPAVMPRPVPRPQKAVTQDESQLLRLLRKLLG